MPVEDAEMTRMIRREISRRYVDSNNIDVRVIHGVVYLRGYMQRLRGHDVDLREELDIILRIIRGRPGIRDVCCEIDLGKSGLKDSARSSQKGRGGF